MHFISYLFLSHTLIALVSRKLQQIAGIVCGLALIDYGFNFIAIGLPGAREMTSQFIGANLLIGGSAAVFISLFFLLRPSESSSSAQEPRIGAKEERALSVAKPNMTPMTGVETVAPLVESTVPIPDTLELRLDQFSRSPSGEYEHKLVDFVYDMISVQPEMVNVWREKRTGMRSVYLAGPYELTTGLLQEHARLGESIRIGILSISAESIQGLLALQKELQTQVPT